MKNKLLISVYSRQSKISPSDYYRVIQYLPYIEVDYIIHDALTEKEYSFNLNMRSGLIKKIYQLLLLIKIHIRRIRSFYSDLKFEPNVIIIQRETIPRVMGVVAGILYKKMVKRFKVIWDFDDDIFSSKEISCKEKGILLLYSKRIIVTSDYLIGLVKNELKDSSYRIEKVNNMIIQLPTTDGFCKKQRIDLLINKRLETYDNEIRLVWVGTKSNLDNFNMIISCLEDAARELIEKYNKRLLLIIVCNSCLNVDTNYLNILNIKWRRDVAEKTISYAHIGIMPLKNTVYSLGKGGFKLIQYISVGVPIIASDVGFNKNIVTDNVGMLVDDKEIIKWKRSIIQLSTNKELWIEMCESAKKRYDDYFNIDDTTKIWKDLIRNN